MNLAALAALLLATHDQGFRDLWVGHTYRFDGDLVSTAPVDTRRIKRVMEAQSLARDVQIGERAPHRVIWTATVQGNGRVQLGKTYPLAPEVFIKLRDVREIKGPEAVVGRRWRGRARLWR